MAPTLPKITSFPLFFLVSCRGLIYYAPETKAPGIFGIPLRQSITYANVAISLIDENGKSYIYGYVPIVVAKCGVFLKEKGMFESPSLAQKEKNVTEYSCSHRN